MLLILTASTRECSSRSWAFDLGAPAGAIHATGDRYHTAKVDSGNPAG
jgi:hypothetical protein